MKSRGTVSHSSIHGVRSLTHSTLVACLKYFYVKKKIPLSMHGFLLVGARDLGGRCLLIGALGKPTCTLIPWRQGFRHPTWNKFMGWFAQIPNTVGEGRGLRHTPLGQPWTKKGLKPTKKKCCQSTLFDFENQKVTITFLKAALFTKPLLSAHRLQGLKI